MNSTLQTLNQALQNRIQALNPPTREIFDYMFTHALSNSPNINPAKIAKSQIEYLETPNNLASKAKNLQDYLINLHYRDILHLANTLNPDEIPPLKPSTLPEAITLSELLKSKLEH